MPPSLSSSLRKASEGSVQRSYVRLVPVRRALSASLLGLSAVSSPGKPDTKNRQPTTQTGGSGMGSPLGSSRNLIDMAGALGNASGDVKCVTLANLWPWTRLSERWSWTLLRIQLRSFCSYRGMRPSLTATPDPSSDSSPPRWPRFAFSPPDPSQTADSTS